MKTIQYHGGDDMNGYDLAITFQTILAIFGAIAAIMAGVSAIAKMLSPFKELKVKVNEHENHLTEHDKRFDSIEKQLASQSKMQREICKSLVVIMNHLATGNSVDKVKLQQEELQKFLIDN